MERGYKLKKRGNGEKVISNQREKKPTETQPVACLPELIRRRRYTRKIAPSEKQK